jgi:hypothetical protein
MQKSRKRKKERIETQKEKKRTQKHKITERGKNT